MLSKILQILGIRRVARRRDPEVILDFIFEEGLFFVSIKNISPKPIYKIGVEFDQKIFGVEGKKEFSALPLFKNIEFLAPQKEIITFLDTSSAYFRREEPTKISARISYQDAGGLKYGTTTTHDLEIYRDLGYVRKTSNHS